MTEVERLKLENACLRASRVRWIFSERQLIERGDLEGMKARAAQREEYDERVHRERDELRTHVAELEAKLATARAVALEEAARAYDGWGESNDTSADYVAHLRALAPLPASLVVVERETIEGLVWLAADLERSRREPTTEQEQAAVDELKSLIRGGAAALALLEKAR